MKVERNDDGVIEDDAEILISNYDEYRELQREARVARQLREAFPLVYDLMVKELNAL